MIPLKEHFLLELKTLDLLLENKMAALRQDHITCVITMNLIRSCLENKHRQFFQQSLQQVHDQYNKIWKWLISLNICLISRNRIFLNTFLAEQETVAKQKSPSDLESSILIKIWDICGGKEAQPQTNDHQIQRVDILFRVKEAEEAPLNFQMENIID